MPNEPCVVIIVLNWNGKEDTVECLRSLQQLSYQNFEILVVDNGSTDGSVAWFRQELPDITLAENNTNLGFAEGNNVGIRCAIRRGADYVLLLNNDTIVNKDFLTYLVAVAENDPSIGFAGPKVYHCNFKGRKDVLSFAGATTDVATGRVYRFGQNTIDRGQYDSMREVDYVEGSCVCWCEWSAYSRWVYSILPINFTGRMSNCASEGERLVTNPFMFPQQRFGIK